MLAQSEDGEMKLRDCEDLFQNIPAILVRGTPSFPLPVRNFCFLYCALYILFCALYDFKHLQNLVGGLDPSENYESQLG